MFLKIISHKPSIPITDREDRLIDGFISAVKNCPAADVRPVPEGGIGEMSDGYHTFNGLYYQRMVLFAALVKAHKDKAWKSWKHEDGELCFGGGWFIVGIDTPDGSYTYHYDKMYWNLFECEELPTAKRWDGHTEKDVTRLLTLDVRPVVRGFNVDKDCPRRAAEGGNMSILIKGMEMPTSCFDCNFCVEAYEGAGVYSCVVSDKCVCRGAGRHDDCPLVPVPVHHGRLIDADALTGQMERNLWAIEDKAEKELGFDETLRRGMQYGHAVCLNAVNDATVVFLPQIVHCCECKYNNHCLTQEFAEEESRIPFDKNTWFCADAKAAPTILPAEEGE